MPIKLFNNQSTLKPSQWRDLMIASSVIATLTVLSGCATKPTYQPNKPSNNAHTVTQNAHGVPSYYQVKQGDTVSLIAARYGLNYRQIGAINNLDSRYTIYTGQWLRLWTTPVTTGAQPQYRPVNNAQTTNTRTTTTRPSSNSTQTQPPLQSQPLSSAYTVPSPNAVIRQYNANAGVMGIWFSGQLGDPVLASNSGTVLYAGDGLPEYGNLVMIRHDKEFVTAYAHNERILVQEGQQVQAGQTIATMGNTGDTSQVALEFQVRQNGSPIDPKKVLNR